MKHFWIETSGWSYQCANCHMVISVQEIITQYGFGYIATHPDEIADDLPKCSLDFVHDAEAALLIKHQGPENKRRVLKSDTSCS